MLLNNTCECFNSCILNARENLIIIMLEDIMVYFIKRMVSKIIVVQNKKK